MGKKVLVIANGSITAGGRVWTKGTVVTAEHMRLDDKQFQALFERGDVQEKPEEEKPEVTLTAPERLGKIVVAIKALFSEDGKPLSPDDFIGTGEPSVEALELALKDTPGFEEGITSEERTEAFDLYLKAADKDSE